MKTLSDFIINWNCARCRLIRHALITLFLFAAGWFLENEIILSAATLLSFSTMLQAYFLSKASENDEEYDV